MGRDKLFEGKLGGSGCVKRGEANYVEIQAKLQNDYIDQGYCGEAQRGMYEFRPALIDSLSKAINPFTYPQPHTEFKESTTIEYVMQSNFTKGDCENKGGTWCTVDEWEKELNIHDASKCLAPGAPKEKAGNYSPLHVLHNNKGQVNLYADPNCCAKWPDIADNFDDIVSENGDLYVGPMCADGFHYTANTDQDPCKVAEVHLSGYTIGPNPVPTSGSLCYPHSNSDLDPCTTAANGLSCLNGGKPIGFGITKQCRCSCRRGYIGDNCENAQFCTIVRFGGRSKWMDVNTACGGTGEKRYRFKVPDTCVDSEQLGCNAGIDERCLGTSDPDSSDGPFGTNMGFEAEDVSDKAIEGTRDEKFPNSFVYTVPEGWISLNRDNSGEKDPMTVLATNGNVLWGKGMDSGYGENYLVLQAGVNATGIETDHTIYERFGVNVSQNLTRLNPGNMYEVRFLAASRPYDHVWYARHGNIAVFVDDVRIWGPIHPEQTFTRFRAVFTAEKSTVTLTFENDPGDAELAGAVFLDDVQIIELEREVEMQQQCCGSITLDVRSADVQAGLGISMKMFEAAKEEFQRECDSLTHCKIVGEGFNGDDMTCEAINPETNPNHENRKKWKTGEKKKKQAASLVMIMVIVWVLILLALFTVCFLCVRKKENQTNAISTNVFHHHHEVSPPNVMNNPTFDISAPPLTRVSTKSSSGSTSRANIYSVPFAEDDDGDCVGFGDAAGATTDVNGDGVVYLSVQGTGNGFGEGDAPSGDIFCTTTSRDSPSASCAETPMSTYSVVKGNQYSSLGSGVDGGSGGGGGLGGVVNIYNLLDPSTRGVGGPTVSENYDTLDNNGRTPSQQQQQQQCAVLGEGDVYNKLDCNNSSIGGGSGGGGANNENNGLNPANLTCTSTSVTAIAATPVGGGTVFATVSPPQHDPSRKRVESASTVWAEQQSESVTYEDHQLGVTPPPKKAMMTMTTTSMSLPSSSSRGGGGRTPSRSMSALAITHVCSPSDNKLRTTHSPGTAETFSTFTVNRRLPVEGHSDPPQPGHVCRNFSSSASSSPSAAALSGGMSGASRRCFGENIEVEVEMMCT